MKICFKNASDLLDGINLVAADLGFTLSCESEADVTVYVEVSKDVISSVTLNGKNAKIVYGNGKARFFRALMELVSMLKASKTEGSITFNPLFISNGAMLDVSRNAVMNLKYLKFYLRKMALLGMNTFMLYTEDTYTVDSRPYFGHMRGRYSKAEIKELDAYAQKLGIELVPCIQVLGHLATALRWAAMAPVKDTTNALLTNCEETYTLIDEMFKSIRECFTSNRIHLGLDETHDLGTGKYLDTFGYRERKDIYFDHLARVTDMAKGYGFKPMMWSDMFFRMSAKGITNFEDFDPRTVLPYDIGKYLPEGVQPVFWDYYHPEESFYSVNIEKHKKLSDNTIFAGGIWCWTSHSPHFSRSYRCSMPALEACKKGGIKEVIATVWHNTSLASLILSIAGLTWFADYDYTSGNCDLDYMKRTFASVTGQSYDEIVSTELPEYPHGGDVGLSMRLFYNDPLLGLIDKHVEGLDTATYYKGVSEKLKDIDGGEFAPAIDVIKKLSSLFENKADFGVRLKKAYDNNDTETLKALANECDVIIEKLSALRESHYSSWMEYNKPFGWEVHDIHYGGLIMRFETAKERIVSFLAGKIEAIAELEEARLRYDCQPEGAPLAIGNFLWLRYHENVTPGLL